MVMQRSKLEQMQRNILFALLLAVFIGALLLLSGCSRVERATVAAANGGVGAYVPGENFADGGTTRCGSVNIPPALKPCR